MPEALIKVLIDKLEPVIYLLGLSVVLLMATFGGTIVSLWQKSKEKKENEVQTNTIAIARLEAKFDLFKEDQEKSMNALFDKIRNLKA